MTSPLTKGSQRLVSPCEDYAAVQKHRKYDESFKGTNFFFCAMVFETLGAVNDEGEEVLRQLFTFAAQHLGREFSSYCSRAWARVSCCLQRAIGQVIANRIDGRPDVVPPTGTTFVVSEVVPGSATDFSEREKESESESEKAKVEGAGAGREQERSSAKQGSGGESEL